MWMSNQLPRKIPITILPLRMHILWNMIPTKLKTWNNPRLQLVTVGPFLTNTGMMNLLTYLTLLVMLSLRTMQKIVVTCMPWMTLIKHYVSLINPQATVSHVKHHIWKNCTKNMVGITLTNHLLKSVQKCQTTPISVVPTAMTLKPWNYA